MEIIKVDNKALSYKDDQKQLRTGSIYTKNNDLYLNLGAESISIGVKPKLKIATKLNFVDIYSIDKSTVIFTIINQIENLKTKISNFEGIDYSELLSYDIEDTTDIGNDLRRYRKDIYALKYRIKEILRGTIKVNI